VDAANRILDGQEVHWDWPDLDLWIAFRDMVRNMRDEGVDVARVLAIQWMPAHLDERSNFAKRDKAIADGLITMADVDGNAAADVLANLGRAKHDDLDAEMWAAHDRRYITMLTQMHLVNVWKHHEGLRFQKDDADATQGQSYELDIIESILAEEPDGYTDDADVFGAIDLDGHEDSQPSRPPSSSHSSAAPLGSLSSRFPRFVTEVDPSLQSDFRITFEQQPSYQHLASTTARILSLDKRDIKKNGGSAPVVSARVPFGFWAFFLEWLSSLQWSVKCAIDPGCSPLATAVTWMELACLFSVSTGYDFAKRDFKDAGIIVAAATRKLIAHIRARSGMCDIGVRAACHTVKSLLGYYLPGLNRRPIANRQLWMHVLEQLHAAHNMHPRRDDFGRGYIVDRPTHLRGAIARDELLFTNLAVQDRILASRGHAEAKPIAVARRGRAQKRAGPCYHGCEVSVIRPNGHMAWHGLPARWRQVVDAELVPQDSTWNGIPVDAQLCSPCYLTVCRLARRLVKCLPAAEEVAVPADGVAHVPQEQAPRAVPKRRRIMQASSIEGGGGTPNARRGATHSGVTASVLALLSDDIGNNGEAQPAARRRKASASAGQSSSQRRRPAIESTAARPTMFGGASGSGLRNS